MYALECLLVKTLQFGIQELKRPCTMNRMSLIQISALLFLSLGLSAVHSSELAPIKSEQWGLAQAAHLLERTGFGGTPEQIHALAKLSPEKAVQFVLSAPAAQSTSTNILPAFDQSPIDSASLDPFPPSRPATTDAAKRDGIALGIAVKPAGTRKLQPVTNQFFFWLRASQLETGRLSHWWANRMVASPFPLSEKMALFWHGHFACSEDKVRDVRKLQQLLTLFQTKGTGNFRELLLLTAQSPAMLAYLDAGVNVKGAPNENFAREIMELFTMGIGHYNETDIREAARAFTGWNFRNNRFVVDAEKHDSGVKQLLGKSGPFNGEQVIDMLLAQPQTADFLAEKLYRFFVRDKVEPAIRTALGKELRDNQYNIAAFLRTLFLSADFYSSAGQHIKSPVELVVGTYRRMGLTSLPGLPDFNSVTSDLGQRLFFPATVAGWPSGRDWITPSTLVARGNFIRDSLFANVAFVAPDRYAADPQIREVARKIARGDDISLATAPDTAPGEMSMSMQAADKDEDFNTRYGSFRGYQMALQKVKPILRDANTIQVSDLIRQSGAVDTAGAVDALLSRFMLISILPAQRGQLIEWLSTELGTTNLKVAQTYMEDTLRQLLHIILSLPEYQLG